MAILLAAFSGYSATIIDDNFDSYTIGSQPPAPWICNIANNPGVSSLTVIGSPTNTAGTGSGIEYVDNGPLGVRLEQDFSAPQYAIRFDFSFSPLRVDGILGNYINAAVVTAGGSSGSSANRFATLRLYDNGTARFQAGSAPTAIGATYIPVAVGTAYKVSFFVNDSVAPVAYIDPNGGSTNVPADSVAYWMDNVYIGGGLLQGGGTGISAGTNGLARVGFGATTTAVGLRYAIDNVKVSQILPPGTSGSLSLYLLGE